MVKAGRTLAEVRAAALTKDLDGKWGKGFLSPHSSSRYCSRSIGGKA